MATDIYKKLAEHLDKLPGGFPPTETGVELRILRRLFTLEEAEFALRLTLIPEEPRVIARRARVTIEEASRRLEEMAGKGLIFRMGPKRGSTKYMASQYVIGIWKRPLSCVRYPWAEVLISSLQCCPMRGQKSLYGPRKNSWLPRAFAAGSTKWSERAAKSPRNHALFSG
jgi:hypothetical protein